MRFLIILLSTFLIWSCHTDSNETPQKKGKDRLVELVPEPDKELRLEAEKKEQQIQNIREKFNQIIQIKDWTKIETKELLESTEGGEANYYYQGDQIKKIVVRYFGETFRQIQEYYLDNDELIFVYHKFYRYNRPITWDSLAMKENNDDQVFDFDKSEIIEKRSYFNKKKMIQQLNQPITDTTLSQYNEGEILNDYNKLMQLITQ